MSSTLQTDAELLSAFRDFMARKNTSGPQTFVPLQNHPLHRGVQDLGYVRPAPAEFPKCVYHVSGLTKIVASREEQDALGVAWSETPAARPKDWRAKLNEVFTKSGFRVYNHHLAFLRSNDVAVETLREAAEFLDSLDAAQQEEFFKEAETTAQPVEAEEEKQQKKSRKVA
jgi:hypothetical protein